MKGLSAQHTVYREGITSILLNRVAGFIFAIEVVLYKAREDYSYNKKHEGLVGSTL